MTEPDLDGPLDAGDSAAWLSAIDAALRGEADADVPCGGCTACCRSRQFVHIAPDETDALAHIPAELLFPAPRLPTGHVLMGYDEHGRCPMLSDVGCTIYDHRPRTCRTYDCRVFAASGVVPDADQPAIAAQAVRWRFRDDTPLASVKAAATWIESHRDELGDDVPRHPTAHAVMAVRLRDGREPGRS